VEQERALCGARGGTVWSKRGHCVEQERALCGAREGTVWSKREHCVEQERALCGARESTVWSKRGHCVEQERALCEAWNRTFPVGKKKTVLIASRLFNGHFNPLNAKLKPIWNRLAFLAHHILHVSRIRVKGEAQTALFKDPVRTAL